MGSSTARRCRSGSTEGRSKAAVRLLEERVNNRGGGTTPGQPAGTGPGLFRHPPRTPLYRRRSLNIIYAFLQGIVGCRPPPPVNSGAIQPPVAVAGQGWGRGRQGRTVRSPRRGTPGSPPRIPAAAGPCRGRGVGAVTYRGAPHHVCSRPGFHWPEARVGAPGPATSAAGAPLKPKGQQPEWKCPGAAAAAAGA